MMTSTELAQASVNAPTSNPNYVLYGAIIAASVAMIVAVFGNFWANRREYDKWRREELIKQIFAVQDVLTDIKESINNGTYTTESAKQCLYKLTDNTFRISVLVGNLFEKQYLNDVAAIVSIVESNQYSGQTLRNQISEQQSMLTNHARKELSRNSPGPFKFMFGIVVFLIFSPLLLLAMLFKWKNTLAVIRERPFAVNFRQAYNESKARREIRKRSK